MPRDDGLYYLANHLFFIQTAQAATLISRLMCHHIVNQRNETLNTPRGVFFDLQTDKNRYLLEEALSTNRSITFLTEPYE